MSSSAAPLVAGIEAGGTKFNVVVGTSHEDIRARIRIPTTKPAETMEQVLRFLTECKRKHGDIKAIGVGCFGPLDLDRSSRTYGFITTTPKRHWQNVDIVGALGPIRAEAIGFDTDVNAAALGEYTWGAGIGMDPLVYLTIGTGIGGGAIVHGKPLHGLMHPEMGHIHVQPPIPTEALFPTCQCPFHKSCLEGYASGPAIAARWGMKTESIPYDHPAVLETASTLALGLASIVLTLSPKRIIIGGGVIKMKGLLAFTQSELVKVLNSYIPLPAITRRIDEYVTLPGLGDDAGIAGAMALGIRALHKL